MTTCARDHFTIVAGMGFPKPWRRWPRVVMLVAFFTTILMWKTHYQRALTATSLPVFAQSMHEGYPLLWKHIHTHKGIGGGRFSFDLSHYERILLTSIAWHIPSDWLDGKDQPNTIVEAAKMAAEATRASAHRRIPYSAIPMIMHQTWKSRRIDNWPEIMRQSVEEWLVEAMREGNELAYFFWEDSGLEELVEEYEPTKIEDFMALLPISQSDVFRIAVTRWIGGIVRLLPLAPRHMRLAPFACRRDMC